VIYQWADRGGLKTSGVAHESVFERSRIPTWHALRTERMVGIAGDSDGNNLE